MARAARLRTASNFLCVAAWITLLATLMSGCGSAKDTFEAHYVAPSWSPDGKSVAFVASDELHLTGLGGRTTVLTDHGSRREVVRDPIWSPDGTKIAYDVCEQSQVNPYCFVSHTVVRDVGSGRSVTFNQDVEPFGSCHVWSPDGRLALLTTRGGSTYLSVANSDGSGLEQLTKAADSATSCPAWSPDSGSIAYACCGIVSDVHLADSDGRNKRRLTHGMYASDISWSPDGEQIAFHSIGDNGQGHLSMRSDGTARRLIAPDATELAWSPDSRRIAYIIERGDENELFVADRDGSNRHLVAHGVCCPSWSPDGEKLAIVKDNPDGRAAIYVIDADGKRPVKVSSPPEAGDS